MISSLVDFAQNLVLAGGYPGVFLAAAIENCILLPPSEVFFPFLGFLAATGKLELLPTVLAGSLGALAGAVFWYGLGYILGRANLKLLIERYGRFMRLHFSDVERAESWFSRWESPAVFFGRMVPVVRTFISVPAGFVRMPFSKFCVYTFAGSLVWVGVLTGAGFWLGENWPEAAVWVENYQAAAALLLVAALVYLGWRFYRHHHR